MAFVLGITAIISKSKSIHLRNLTCPFPKISCGTCNLVFSSGNANGLSVSTGRAVAMQYPLKPYIAEIPGRAVTLKCRGNPVCHQGNTLGPRRDTQHIKPCRCAPTAAVFWTHTRVNQ
jgi:hypothetical protein